MKLSELEARLAGRVPRIQGAEAEYAVLALLSEEAGALRLIFEVRADTLSRQPGEVCFPGGRVERGETPRDCALRETWEELGIPREEVRVLAPLDKLVHQGGFLVHPFLARVTPEGYAAMRPGPAEVKEVFTVPLSFFLDTPPLRYTYDLVPDVGEDFPYGLIGFPKGYAWRRGHVEVPIYHWQGRAVWGLTGRIVERLTELLR